MNKCKKIMTPNGWCVIAPFVTNVEVIFSNGYIHKFELFDSSSSTEKIYAQGKCKIDELSTQLKQGETEPQIKKFDLSEEFSQG